MSYVSSLFRRCQSWQVPNHSLVGGFFVLGKAVALMLLTFSWSFTLSAQRQNDHWYFGYNSALQFSNGVLTPLTNSAMTTSEGSASVSDRQTGNLLFYTNGISVWNRNHSIMPNGSGLLGGSAALTSSTTAALIVPRPGNLDQFYVFTVDEAFGAGGLRLNVVDMTLNAGLGDVVNGQKNILIENNTYEKLGYAPRTAGGYWLVAQKTDNVYCAWPITSTGIGQAVVSIAGAGTSNPSGWIKFSGDYTKMASVNPFGGVDLHVFDPLSGTIQSLDTLSLPCCGSVYGLEFSPSGRFLYASSIGKGVFQFDLTAASVNGSAVYLGANSDNVASLQLGPDCIVYAAGAGALASIPYPDSLAPNCGFVLSAANVGTAYGLPPKVFYTDETDPIMGPIAVLDSCANDSIRFALNIGSNSHPTQWTLFGMTGTTQSKVSTNGRTSFAGIAPGTYLIQCTGFIGCRSFLLQDTVNAVDCSNTCPVKIEISGSCSDESIRIRAVGPNTVQSIQWILIDAQDSSFTRSSNDLVWVINSVPPGNYRIEARSVVYCATSGTRFDTTFISWTVEDCFPCTLYVPNAFTPNGDLVNDGFLATLDSCTYKEFNLKIFNRWGNLIFGSTDPLEPWKPTDVPDGVYAYRVLVQDARGRVAVRSGFVHLIR